MKAVAVFPHAGGAQLIDVPEPTLEGLPHGRGVIVKVLAVGVDGTDKEILAGEYGSPPPGEDYLITGHESFGIVEEVGPDVATLRPGDYVVATVRRPGGSPYDAIGRPDFTTDDVYYERGINLRHGFLTERYLESEEHLISVPPGLRDVGVLLEPTSIVEKGVSQAYEIQRRLKVWRPRRAAVLGAGTVGLLATLALRLRGLEVHAFATKPKPNLNASLLEETGATYHSVSELPFEGSAQSAGPYDLIFEATGFAPLAFQAMGELGKNGVLILSSVTGGKHTISLDADRLNLQFVLGNKVMLGTVNAGREHFELAVGDFALAELTWPGWLRKLLTHRVGGLADYEQLLRSLTSGQDAIKVYCEVSS
jgi:threonine dehydrogenase-like Zn-dependent dehydrogenase